MTSQLITDFPELQSYSSALSPLNCYYYSILQCRKEDLEDLLTDQLYFQAVFHSLPRVKAMIQAQSELGMANETIASESFAYHASPLGQAPYISSFREQPQITG